MKKILIFSSLALLLFVSSCTVKNKMIAGATMDARLNLTTADLEYVGDVSGTATQYYVLGIPYGNRRLTTANTGGILGSISVDRAFNNALYDALSQKPDADFVLPLSSESTTSYSFLGRKVTLKVRAKAFKIKGK
jgi:hypothetical protein